MKTNLTGFRACVRTDRLQNQSRRACPELVERGRLEITRKPRSIRRLIIPDEPHEFRTQASTIFPVEAKPGSPSTKRMSTISIQGWVPSDRQDSGVSVSCKLVQIGVRRRMAQGTAHGDDLAFVMESVGKDVMKDESRCANGFVPIGEKQFCICIELLVTQA